MAFPSLDELRILGLRPRPRILVLFHHPEDALDSDQIRAVAEQSGVRLEVQANPVVERGQVYLCDPEALIEGLQQFARIADRIPPIMVEAARQVRRAMPNSVTAGVNLLAMMQPDAQEVVFDQDAVDPDRCWRYGCRNPVPRTDDVGLCETCKTNLREA